ncbi:MAG: CopG family transcriptional regulator [Gemmatimonadetes bacterium]|nr:CopG family transcriptional regulator [Gemmatimonadota bacterium]
MAITRTSITIPAPLLGALDRKAKELDRSRSWVIAEAVRRFLAAPTISAKPPPAVRESAAPSYAAAVDVAAARRHHLATDLTLPLAERLRRTEELGRLGREAQRRRGIRHQVIGFDSYEDYYEWKKKARLGGG